MFSSTFNRSLSLSLSVHTSVVEIENNLTDAVLSGDYRAATAALNDTLNFYQHLARHVEQNCELYPSA